MKNNPCWCQVSLPAFAYLSWYSILCCLQLDFCGERNVMNVVIWSSPDTPRGGLLGCVFGTVETDDKMCNFLKCCFYVFIFPLWLQSQKTITLAAQPWRCPEGEWCCLLVLFAVLMYLCAFIMDDVLMFGPLWTLCADFVCGNTPQSSLESPKHQVQCARGLGVCESVYGVINVTDRYRSPCSLWFRFDSFAMNTLKIHIVKSSVCVCCFDKPFHFLLSCFD